MGVDTNAFLTSSSGPFQHAIVEGVLKEAGIEYDVRETSALSWLGVQPTEGYLSREHFWVPEERLQEAKDILCANGIVCEVSGRLLRRSLEEIVKPLLGAKDRNLDRLLRFVEINNKETVRALFDATLDENGGQDLLEDLFFHLATAGEGGFRDLRILARALQKRVGDPFWERFLAAAVGGAKEVRLALLQVLPELPLSPQRVEALVRALRDKDGEIRDAASEALFAIQKVDFGYDPEDPQAEREEAIERFLKTLPPRWE